MICPTKHRPIDYRQANTSLAYSIIIAFCAAYDWWYDGGSGTCHFIVDIVNDVFISFVIFLCFVLIEKVSEEEK